MLDVVVRGALDFARMNTMRFAALAAVGADIAAGVFVPPTCSGPRLALAARSDGAFCVDVLGFVADR